MSFNLRLIKLICLVLSADLGLYALWKCFFHLLSDSTSQTLRTLNVKMVRPVISWL